MWWPPSDSSVNSAPDVPFTSPLGAEIENNGGGCRMHSTTETGMASMKGSEWGLTRIRWMGEDP